MNCNRMAEYLQENDDLLSIPSELVQHIESCERCRSELLHERSLIDAVGTYTQDEFKPSSRFFEQLESRIRNQGKIIKPGAFSRFKKIWIASSAAAVILLVIAAHFFMAAEKTASDTVSDRTASANGADSFEGIAAPYVLSDQVGQIRLMRGDQPGWISAAKPVDSAHIGDSLQTLNDSSVSLLYAGDSKIKLKENSYVKLHDSFIRLNAGHSWLLINTRKEGPKDFAVKTPAASVRVTGTCFEVSHSEKYGTRVKVHKGTVVVENSTGKIELTSGNSASVKDRNSTIRRYERKSGKNPPDVKSSVKPDQRKEVQVTENLEPVPEIKGDDDKNVTKEDMTEEQQVIEDIQNAGSLFK